MDDRDLKKKNKILSSTFETEFKKFLEKNAVLSCYP